MTAQDELGELYHAGYRRLVAQVYAFTTDLTEAQDAVQEAFARALARRHGLRDVDAPEAWLRTVAINVVRRRWRRRQLLDTILLRERPLTRMTAAAPEPDNTDLRAALAGIPSRYREVIVLHYLADLPLDEVADILEVPVGTVKSRLSRGREALRGLLDDVEAPPLEQVRVRAGRLRARRQAAQVGSVAAVLLVAVVGLLQPWRPGPSPYDAAASPAPSASPGAYQGAGITISAIPNPATAPDLPGLIDRFELDGQAGWLRTTCTAAETDCLPRFARTADGGRTWLVEADTGVALPAPATQPPLTRSWLARRPTVGGVWWAGGQAAGKAPALASSSDGGATWHLHELAGAAAGDLVTATVRGEDVVALTTRAGRITGVYAGSDLTRVSDGGGMRVEGEPVLLPDGRLMIAAESRFQLSTDLGAGFTAAPASLPTVGSLRATSGGYVALDLFRAGWVAVSTDGVTWRKLAIR
ncbi:RNA polymerase sigma factor [Catellatospora sp. NPDC049609]|uniref:RNA polymerase sigma factor n=1 Tax=Catellatospora sp. NPDC049609 TaxID=3155505 RepID=UPI00342D0C63